jgi:long-chain fatty acid transport protein
MAMTIQPSLAYRIDDRWSLGVGMTANYGLLKLERVALVGGGSPDEKDTDWEFGGRIGVMYEPSKATRLGLVWTSKVEYDFSINATVAGILPGRTHSFPVKASVNAPQQVMGSAYHALNDRWALTGNLGWQDWSQFSQNTVETNAGTSTSSLRLQDTWHAALGAQYRYSEKTRVNAGIAYDNSFYKDQDRTVFALPNGDTWRIGAGVQYTLSPKSELGLAAEYARSDSSSDPSPLLGGKFDHPYMVFLSAHYSHRF